MPTSISTTVRVDAATHSRASRLAHGESTPMGTVIEKALDLYERTAWKAVVGATDPETHSAGLALPEPWAFLWQGEQYAAAVNQKTGECRPLRRTMRGGLGGQAHWRWATGDDPDCWKAVCYGLMKQSARPRQIRKVS